MDTNTPIFDTLLAETLEDKELLYSEEFRAWLFRTYDA